MTARTDVAAIEAILEEGGIENAAQEARWIAVEARDGDQALMWARRRAAGEPLQYVIGSVPFRHVSLEVGPGVFIPRPETELVAGRAIELLPQDGIAIDLCTGSGAIAATLADERPAARIFATERSETAIGWARRNVPERVELLQGDLFEPVDPSFKGMVDVVVANPPYISPGAELPSVVIDHEPHEALFADRDGLDVIRAIVAEAGSWLKTGGALVLEIGETQGSSVIDLMTRAGFRSVSVALDLAGRDRIAEGFYS